MEKNCSVQKQAGNSACLACLESNTARLEAAGCTQTCIGWCGPQGPTYQTVPQWEHSTFSGTVRNLFNISNFLTKRDAWAGDLQTLLLDKPRTDTPMHFPEPPAPQKPWTPPPHASSGGADDAGDEDTALLLDGGRRLAASTEPAAPQHCSRATGRCPGATEVNTHQMNQMAHIAARMGIEVSSSRPLSLPRPLPLPRLDQDLEPSHGRPYVELELVRGRVAELERGAHLNEQKSRHVSVS